MPEPVVITISHRLGKEEALRRLRKGFAELPANFGSYNKTYGSLGAVVGFMTWIWLSVTVILLGAELDAEMERQTECDTTVGAPKPIGARGATVADSKGPAQ